MGEVCRATDTKLNRDVSLKILPKQFASDSQRMGRFQREAEVLASLDHPNIGQIYGIEEAGATKALVLQLVEGPTLAERIAQGPIPVEDTLQIALQIAEGLEAAHEKGVIHRDLKPANIKITPEGQVKILDFGLAKALEGEAPDSSLSQSPTLTNAVTQAGVILGTAAYMSPEQARGHALDRRTDVWAFGCVLFEMLSGKMAFPGEDITDILAAIVRAEPEWNELPPSLNSRVRELLERCLQKDLRRRKQSIADVRVEVGELEQTPMAETGERQPEVPVGKRVAATGLAAGIVLGVVVTFTLLALRSDSGEIAGGVSRFPIQLPPEVANTDVAAEYPNSMIAISPDGSRFAVIGGPSHALYVRELDDVEFRKLPGTTDARNSFFSPDGNQIAFFTANTNQLKVVSLAEGSQPQPMASVPTSDYAFGSWGDNGVIIFSTVDSGLFQVSVEDRNVKVLTAPVGIVHKYPRVLPGSGAVVFTAEEADTTTVQVLDLDTPDAVPVTLFPNASNAHYLASDHLLFAREGNLWAAPFDMDHLSVGLPESVPLNILFDVPLAHDPVPQLAVSLNGTLVFAQGGSQRSGRLVWVDREGNVVDDLGPAPGGSPALQLSPDDSKLALEYRDGSDVVVSIFDMTRRIVESSPIRKSQPFRGVPVWRNEDQLVLSRPGISKSEMFLLDVIGGSGTEPLFEVDGSWLYPFSLSSDGMRLLFNVDPPGNSGSDIGVYDFGSESYDWVLNGPDWEDQPAWSPNGRALAYIKNSSGQFEVWVKPYPTGSAIKVSLAEGKGPLWSPTGTELFFQSKLGAELWVVPINSTATEIEIGEARMLFEGPYDQSGDAGMGFDVSNDGQRFLMVQIDPEEWVARRTCGGPQLV